MDKLSLKLKNTNINYALAIIDLNTNVKVSKFTKIREKIQCYFFKNKKLTIRFKTKLLGLVPFTTEELKNKYLESIDNTNLLAINVNIIH